MLGCISIYKGLCVNANVSPLLLFRVKLKHFSKFSDMTDALAGNLQLMILLHDV